MLELVIYLAMRMGWVLT